MLRIGGPLLLLAGLVAFASWFLGRSDAPDSVEASSHASEEGARGESAADRASGPGSDGGDDQGALAVSRSRQPAAGGAGAQDRSDPAPARFGDADSARTVVGRVVDETGAPLTGVEVRAIRRWRETEAAEPAFSDAVGEFRLDVEGSLGDLWVRAMPEGLVWIEKGVPAGLEGPTLNVGTLVAEQGAILVGTVRDDRGRPLADAEVSAWSRRNAGATPGVLQFGPSGIRRSTRSDEFGRFEIVGMEPGTATATAKAEHHQPGTAADIVLQRLERSAAVEFALQPGFEASGAVVDGEGAPVADAEVRVMQAGVMIVDPWSGSPGETVRTDEAGRFSFTGLSEGGARFDITRPGYRPLTEQDVEVGPGLRFVVERASAIVGRVVDPTGKALPDFTVRVLENRWGPGVEPIEVLIGDDAAEHLAAGVDPTGCFAIPGVRSRSVSLDVTAEGYCRARVGPISIGDASVDLLEVVLKPGVDVSGVVRDPEGLPVAGARVSLQVREPEGRSGAFAGELALMPAAPRRSEPTTRHEGRETMVTSDEEGRFVLAGLVPGEFSVRADHRRWVASESQALDLEEGGEVPGPLELELREGGSLVGLTLDATGAILPGARVRLERDGASEGNVHRLGRPGGGPNSELSDGEGRYELHGIPPGDYRAWVEEAEAAGSAIVVFSMNAPSSSTRGVQVSIEAGVVVEMDLRMEAKATLLVEVTDGTRGVPGVRLNVRTGEGGWQFSQAPITDQDGFCRLEDLQPGDAILSVEPSAGSPELQQEVQLMAGVAISHAVELPGTRLRGRVVDAAGVGVAGVRLRLTEVGDRVESPPSPSMGMGVFALDIAGSGMVHVGGPGRSGPQGAFTDERGDFVIPYVRAGTWSLGASHEALLPVEAVEFELGPTDPEPFLFEAQRAGVLLVHCSGLEGGRIDAEMRAVEGDAPPIQRRTFGSELRIGSLAPGTYELNLSGGSKSWSGTVEVGLGEQEVQAELR